MANSEGFASFDIVLVPFPFSDRMAEKRRPALIISHMDRVSGYGHLWLAMVTSAMQERLSTDIEIPDLMRAGLPSPSLVRTSKITTTEISRVLRRLGRIDTQTAHAVREQVLAQLA